MIYIELAEKFPAAGMDHTHIQAYVNYDARRGGVLLVMTAVEVEAPTRTNFVGFATLPFGSPSGWVLLEASNRNSKKKLQAWGTLVQHQVNVRDGAAWKAISDFADKHGMKIKPVA